MCRLMSSIGRQKPAIVAVSQGVATSRRILTHSYVGPGRQGALRPPGLGARARCPTTRARAV